MDIVDSQVHIGPGAIDRTLAAMDALGIRSLIIDELWMQGFAPGYALDCGIVRAATPTAELAAILHPERFSYLRRIDRLDPELAGIIRLTRDVPNARAFRIIPGFSRSEITAFATGAYDDLFTAVADAGLPLFVYVPGKAGLVTRYARRFPDLRIIVDHCGMPQRAESEDQTQLSRQFVEVLALADHLNVALKWAHAPAMFNARGYPGEPMRLFLRGAIQAYGAERVMWASDVTANQTGETWGELLFSIRGNPDLSPLETEWILGRTARKWLSWEA